MDEFLTDPEPYLRRLAEEEIWRKRQRQRMERLRREQLRRNRRRKRYRHNNPGVSLQWCKKKRLTNLVKQDTGRVRQNS